MNAPWIANGRERGDVVLSISRAGKPTEDRVVSLDRSIFAREADVIAGSIAKGETQCREMTWADTLGNLAATDSWRNEIGLIYGAEETPAYTLPLSGTPLRVAEKATMPYSSVSGLDKRISRLVMGMDNQLSIAHATAMFDDFYARGGNCFDSAHIYGGGVMERLFGEWHTNRDIRDDIVLIGKGAHTPNCFPDAIHTQLDISLNRLQTDALDIYFLHRDDTSVPVDEWIDALNAEVDAGRIRLFGGSNWTTERLDAANDYATDNDRQGFSAVSNNFSLAQMIDPVWPGCIAASTPDFKTWLVDNQMTLFPWSSQARGFFVPDRAHPDIRVDDMLVRSWYSPENFERQGRCVEIAKRRAVQPVSVALAYVLHQPFPVFPLIGPRHISETVSSCEALSVSLSEEEMAFLNLES